MYVPSSFDVTDGRIIESFISRYGFATDRDFTKAALVDLVKHEGTRSDPWRVEGLAPDVFDKLASAIVAFEMPGERIEGKFKLGQNRSREDRGGMLAGLEREGTSDAELLARFIREHAGV